MSSLTLDARAVCAFWWVRIPSLTSRSAVNAAVLLSDGDYLRRWTSIAASAPPIAFLTGLVAGARHPGAVYTYSIGIVAVLAVVAGLSGALGFWAWLGFAVGDFIFFPRSGSTTYPLSPYWTWSQHLLRVDLPLLISYLILASLLVLLPLAGMRVRAQAGWTLSRLGALAVPAAYVCQAIAQGAFAFLWTQSTPFLIRPIWTFQGQMPDIQAMYPFQHQGIVVAIATTVAIAVRAQLALRGARNPQDTNGLRKLLHRSIGQRPLSPHPWPPWISIPAVGLYSGLLLSGLCANVAQGLLVAALVIVALVARRAAVPRIPMLPNVIHRVPAVMRLAACLLVIRWLTAHLVTPAINVGAESFSSLLTTLIISSAVAALLLPAVPARQRGDVSG